MDAYYAVKAHTMAKQKKKRDFLAVRTSSISPLALSFWTSSEKEVSCGLTGAMEMVGEFLAEAGILRDIALGKVVERRGHGLSDAHCKEVCDFLDGHIRNARKK